MANQHVKIISGDFCSVCCSSHGDLCNYKKLWQQPDSPVNIEISDTSPIIFLTGRVTASMLAVLLLWTKTSFKRQPFWWERVRQRTEEPPENHLTKTRTESLWAKATTGTQADAVSNLQLRYKVPWHQGSSQEVIVDVKSKLVLTRFCISGITVEHNQYEIVDSKCKTVQSFKSLWLFVVYGWGRSAKEKGNQTFWE